MTFRQAVGRYCEEVMPDAIDETTAKRYLVSFRAVLPTLGDLYADTITRKEISTLIGVRKKRGVKNATIMRDLTAVSRVLASAIGWGVCEHNAAREYDRTLIRETRDPIDLPTPEEVAAAIALPSGFSRIMAAASQTGMREGELIGLRWPQVETNRRAVNLRDTKGGRPRTIPLEGPLLEDALGTFSGTPRHATSKLVFWHGEGLPWRNFAANFRVWRVKNKVGFRFHDLRHYFAVMYLRGGGNIYDLQQILGHASIKTTEGYLRFLTPEEKRKSMHGPSQNPAQ